MNWDCPDCGISVTPAGTRCFSCSDSRKAVISPCYHCDRDYEAEGYRWCPSCRTERGTLKPGKGVVR